MIDIVIEDRRWREADIETLGPRAAHAVLSYLNLPADSAEVSILACGDDRIAALNTEFRQKDGPTNVLSWPAEDRAATQPGGIPPVPVADPDGTLPLGDIAISYDRCAAEAAAQGKPLTDHAMHLLVHGLLHLLGYDHIRDPDATLMEKIETAILGKLGIDDPY